MMYHKIIDCTYDLYISSYEIRLALEKLSKYNLLSLDLEVQSKYSQDEIKCSKEYIKTNVNIDNRVHNLIANSSGLSNPRISKITHFIFGVSQSHSLILICEDYQIAKTICNWVVKASYIKFLIHNSSFDLKIINYITGKFPTDYEDTQLMSKCMINNTQVFKANTGLKMLMGKYYSPKWGMFDDYTNTNYIDKNVLFYCAIDGASVFKLYALILKDKKWE